MTENDYVNDIVHDFNDRLRSWETLTNLRANFGFRYNEQGRKEMYVIDIDKSIEPPSVDTVKEIAGILAKAADIRIERIGEATSDGNL